MGFLSLGHSNNTVSRSGYDFVVASEYIGWGEGTLVKTGFEMFRANNLLLGRNVLRLGGLNNGLAWIIPSAAGLAHLASCLNSSVVLATSSIAWRRSSPTALQSLASARQSASPVVLESL